MGFGRLIVQRSSDQLLTMRYLFATFCWAIVAIGVVVAILGDLVKDPRSPGQAIAVIAAAACVSLVAQKLVPRPLDCTSSKSLADSYRIRFFLRVAFSESVSLLAFALGIAWGPWWLFYIGAPFTLVGFWRLAPTRRNLQAEQDRMSLSGCQLSLTAALRTPAS